MANANLVSPKVVAGTAGGVAGVVLSSLVVWLAGALILFFSGVHGAFTQQMSLTASSVVPDPLKDFLTWLLVAVGVFIPGWNITDPARVNSASLSDSTFEEADYQLDNRGVGPDPVEESVNDEPEVVAEVEEFDPSDTEEEPEEVETSEAEDQPAFNGSSVVPVIGSPPHS